MILLFCFFALLVGAQTRDIRVRPVAATVKTSFEKQAKVALLIGIGQYAPASGMSSLKYAVRDVDVLAGVLESQGYVVRKLVDSQATRSMVRKSIRELSDVVQPNQGTLLVFFGGHGFTKNGLNYLATFGVTSDDLEGEGLPVRDVEMLLRLNKARQKLLFIDACRNEPESVTRSGTARSFKKLAAAEGLKVLYSTREGRVSFEDDALKQGVFSYFLGKGLAGEAAGSDGLVTFRDLTDFVADRMVAYGMKQGKVQSPFESGESSGDFLLASTVKIRPEEPPVSVERPLHQQPLSTPQFMPRIKINTKDSQRYAWLPDGKFQMGCSRGDAECQEDESPVREIAISQSFWLGQTEVTVAAYSAFAKVTKRTMPDWPEFQDRMLNMGWHDEQQPMVNVTWQDAADYCKWAGARLPTEAEWEYAARGGSSALRFAILDEIAWFAGNSGKAALDSQKAVAQGAAAYAKSLYANENGIKDVGQKRLNKYRLYDLLGNVWEWTADWYGKQAYTTNEAVDPQGPLSGKFRVVRGGAWSSPAANMRVSYRHGMNPEERLNITGFRCAANALQ